MIDPLSLGLPQPDAAPRAGLSNESGLAEARRILATSSGSGKHYESAQRNTALLFIKKAVFCERMQAYVPDRVKQCRLPLLGSTLAAIADEYRRASG